MNVQKLCYIYIYLWKCFSEHQNLIRVPSVSVFYLASNLTSICEMILMNFQSLTLRCEKKFLWASTLDVYLWEISTDRQNVTSSWENVLMYSMSLFDKTCDVVSLNVRFDVDRFGVIFKKLISCERFSRKKKKKKRKKRSHVLFHRFYILSFCRQDVTWCPWKNMSHLSVGQDNIHGRGKVLPIFV